MSQFCYIRSAFTFCFCLILEHQHTAVWLWVVMDACGIASSSSSSSNPKPPHVLAVDDSIVDRKIVENLLKNSACKVTTAENGMRALEFLGLVDEQEQQNNQSSNVNGTKVNLVITDYCMPGMTGYELLKKIKESSVMKEVPVVVVSSENVPTRINECLEKGAQMFMLKPLKPSDVKKLTGHLIN